MPKANVRGLEMFYEMQGDGPAVVLVGGLSQDHLGWAFQAPALAAAGYRVVTPDNRDAGQTAQSPGPYTIGQMADDTVGLLDVLGISSAHIVGLSMGGMIGQEIAIRHPARVSTLTLAGTSAATDSTTAGVLRAWRSARPQCDPVEFTLMVSAWLFTYRFLQQPEAVQQLVELVRTNPFPQSAAGFQRQCDAVIGHDARGRLSSISAPTLVVVGAEDTLTPPRLARELANGIPGARLAEIPNAAHVLTIEAADAFNSALIGFLRGTSGT